MYFTGTYAPHFLTWISTWLPQLPVHFPLGLPVLSRPSPDSSLSRLKTSRLASYHYLPFFLTLPISSLMVFILLRLQACVTSCISSTMQGTYFHIRPLSSIFLFCVLIIHNARYLFFTTNLPVPCH
jgi:hypothetical protein